jgi:hypothetical protein
MVPMVPTEVLVSVLPTLAMVPTEVLVSVLLLLRGLMVDLVACRQGRRQRKRRKHPQCPDDLPAARSVPRASTAIVRCSFTLTAARREEEEEEEEEEGAHGW